MRPSCAVRDKPKRISKSMYSIGEFSQVTGLTIKTLRFYHEQGVLAPSRVDPHSGYRYYDDQQMRITVFTFNDSFCDST